MKDSPLKPWSFSTGPYMWTPHEVHACRRIVALGFTTLSLSPLAVTLTLSVGTTATTEKVAPFGFQHCVQPQAWSCRICPSMLTVTGLSVHRQTSVPPLKLSDAGFMPLST